MESDISLGIVYDGQTLNPMTRYTWNHTVWDQDDNEVSGSSWFETRLMNLNPVGSGNNYISFPMVADIGFWMTPGQKARFPNLEVRNYRTPSNPLFAEYLSDEEHYEGAFSSFIDKGLTAEDGAYVITGGADGVFLATDPSRNAMPMLRSEFQVNRLWKNITWSMRGNFLSIPTDTPARNERMGWGGDISVFSRSSTYLADAGPFLRRHMLAMRDIQRADGRFTDVAPVGGGFGGILWGSAGITVAWETYRQYGDIAMLDEHYDAMKRYMAYLETRIDSTSGILIEGPLGDWLSPENGKNDNTLLWSAYYIYDLELMAQNAEVLGKENDTAAFWTQHKLRKEHFNETHVDSETGKTIGTGFRVRSFGGGQPPEAGSLIDTQVSYAVPLALGVFDEKNESLAIKHLVEAVQRTNVDDAGIERPAYSLMTGFIGTAWISKALSNHGYHEEAYRLYNKHHILPGCIR